MLYWNAVNPKTQTLNPKPSGALSLKVGGRSEIHLGIVKGYVGIRRGYMGKILDLKPWST